MVQSILGTTSLWVQRCPMTGDPYPNINILRVHISILLGRLYIYIYYIYIHSCDSFPPEKNHLLYSTSVDLGDMNGYDTWGYPQISGHVSRGWWKPTISLPRIDAEELRVDVNMLSNNGTRFEALQAVCQGRDFFCASHVGLVGLSNNRGYWDIPSYGYFEAAHFLNHQVEWDSLSSDKAMFHVWPKSVFLMKGFRSKNWSESGVQLVHWPNDLLSIWPIWPKIWFDEMGVSLFRPCGYFRIVSFVVWKKNEFGKQHFLAGNSCRPGTFLSRAARTGKEALCHGIQWDD